MLKITHIEAAKAHYEVAEEYKKKSEEEKDPQKKIGLRTVAAQNYFYAGINAIEAVLADSIVHSADHEERLVNIERNYTKFKNPQEIHIKYLPLLKSSEKYRSKVAYKGENGNKFLSLIEFAKVCMKEIGAEENE